MLILAKSWLTSVRYYSRTIFSRRRVVLLSMLFLSCARMRAAVLIAARSCDFECLPASCTSFFNILRFVPAFLAFDRAVLARAPHHEALTTCNAWDIPPPDATPVHEVMPPLTVGVLPEATALFVMKYCFHRNVIYTITLPNTILYAIVNTPVAAGLIVQCVIGQLFIWPSSFPRSIGLSLHPSRDAVHSWRFIVRSGLYALVSEPSRDSSRAWLRITFDFTR